MKNLLACLLWATCLLPTLAYAQINPKDLVGVWLIDSVDGIKMDSMGYAIFFENGFAENASMWQPARICKWILKDSTLLAFASQVESPIDSSKITHIDAEKLIIISHNQKIIFKKTTKKDFEAYKNSPELKTKIQQLEKAKEELIDYYLKEQKEKLLPYCGTWTCKVGKNKITLQLKEDGDFIYQAGKEQASGSWKIEYDVLDIAFSMENNDYKVGRQNYRLQIISQTDKELKTKDFLTQTILVWRR